MCKVNFLDEFRSIMRYASQNSLSLRERIFWIALFYIANDRAVYNVNTKTYEWPDGFFPVSNSELFLYSCLDKRAIDTLRNQLKQRGLIEFISGSRNSRPPSYKLNYLSLSVGCKIVPNDVPNNVPNNTSNNVPNNVPNETPSEAPLPKPSYNHERNEINANTTTPVPSRSAARGDGGGVGIGYGELIAYARENLRSLTRDNEARLVAFAKGGMDTQVIRKAINEACSHDCPTYGYVYTILDRYKKNGILTLMAARADDEAHRKATAPQDKQKPRHNYLQHDYTEQDFSGIYYNLDAEYPAEEHAQ